MTTPEWDSSTWYGSFSVVWYGELKYVRSPDGYMDFGYPPDEGDAWEVFWRFI